MAKKSTRSKKAKKAKVKICPPALAKGVKTTTEVKPIKRPRGQGPRKLIKKGPRLKKRKGRTRKWIDQEPVVDNKPKRPNHLPWTTKSRRILNEQKERMARRKRLSAATKRTLWRQQRNAEWQQINTERKMKRLRRRLHNLFNEDVTHD